MALSALADTLVRGLEERRESISEGLFEPVIRLGVTGLARSGKTVFITSLVANLRDRGHMLAFLAEREGRVIDTFLQPPPDNTVPRFDYEAHLQALTAPKPRWPESTRTISQLRLSFRLRPAGLFAGLGGPRTVHLDIFDYPGEWLLDLTLLDKTFDDWSAEVLGRIDKRPAGERYREVLSETDASTKFNEGHAKLLSEAFALYLHATREAGYSDCTPGRLLLPGDLAGSPVVTFAPLRDKSGGRKSLRREFERRFEAYKAEVVKPFFRNHFARIDCQVVLVDALGAMQKSPAAVEELRRTMTEILSAFRPGRNAFLSRILRGRRVERFLFAATKADHVHHTRHPRLTRIVEELARSARERANFSDAKTEALAIAAARATTEVSCVHKGEELDMVSGTLETGERVKYHFNPLPEGLSQLLDPAREETFETRQFAPAKTRLKPGHGLPHIRLDQAFQFLIGHRL